MGIAEMRALPVQNRAKPVGPDEKIPQAEVAVDQGQPFEIGDHVVPQPAERQFEDRTWSIEGQVVLDRSARSLQPADER